MNPQIVKNSVIEDNGEYRFTLKDIHRSLANGLRRIILSEIPAVVFSTENYEDANCKIEVNTGRLHNEILRQRLGCIPIHEKVPMKEGESDRLSGKYILEVDVKNETDNIMFVTTEHFKIKNKATEHYLTEEDTRRIFPMNQMTQSYIVFARLRPKLSDTIPGEQLKLTCEFSVSSSKVDSRYNVVSKCAFQNTIDRVAADSAWEKHEEKLREEETANEEIAFQKWNFEILDAQRYFIENSYDFVIQTIGVYENVEIVKMACIVLQHKFVDFIQAIDADTVPITMSETTIDNCFDITLENEDYTMGEILSYLIYETNFVKNKIITFCGFKKYHPHDSYSVLRVAFVNETSKMEVRQCIRSACVDAQTIYKMLYVMF